MTIDDITGAVRQHTYGLLSDGEVVYAVQMALESYGGIDPDDIESVDVRFGHGSLDIRFTVREGVTIIDLGAAS